jgi:transposase
VRFAAVELLGQGIKPRHVARRLRVTRKSVYEWRQTWRAEGLEGLRSKGPGGSRCQLDDDQLQRLREELKRGPAAHGWDDDQRWTAHRVADLVHDLFRVSYTDRGMAYPLKRIGYTPRVPVHRAAERDERAVEAWVREVWPRVQDAAAAQHAWLVFEDESGQGLRPPKARTWAPRGQRPILSVSGRGRGRVSMTGLVCARPDGRTRLFYRIHVYHGRRRERKGFTERDYIAAIRAAHHQLKAPIVLVWDNLNIHTSQEMRAFVDAHADWLTVFQLPAYAPELNPAEGVWSHLKRALGNLAARTLDQLAVTIKSHLKRIQYRPDLINGFIAETGLDISLEPVPP